MDLDFIESNDSNYVTLNRFKMDFVEVVMLIIFI